MLKSFLNKLWNLLLPSNHSWRRERPRRKWSKDDSFRRNKKSRTDIFFASLWQIWISFATSISFWHFFLPDLTILDKLWHFLAIFGSFKTHSQFFDSLWQIDNLLIEDTRADPLRMFNFGHFLPDLTFLDKLWQLLAISHSFKTQYWRSLTIW